MGLELKTPDFDEPFEGMFNLFDEIEKISSRNSKEKLLSQFNGAQRILVELALNPYKQFHTTQKAVNINLQSQSFYDVDMFPDFIELCAYLQKTNHCSESEVKIARFYRDCNSQQRKWYERILNKELRFGLMAKSVNKVFSDLIPSFEVALCNKAEKDLSNIDFSRGIWAEYKYDGFRTTIQKNNIIEILGRSGKEITNEAFRRIILKAWGNIQEIELGHLDLFLDGEAYIENIPFESLSSVLRTEDKSLPSGTKFVLFDVIALRCFKEKLDSESFELRQIYRHHICSILNEKLDYEFFQEPISRKVKNIQEIWDFYDEAINAGYEGLVLKYMDEIYPFKRSDAMLKVKPEDKLDACIIGFYEGEKNRIGTLGGFIVELEDGKQVRVGGGYKKWQWIEYWINPQQYVGQWITVKYTQKTQDGSLRHPRFGGFRDNKEIS